MATFCLMPEMAEKFKKALVDGTIDINKVSNITSSERRAFFEEFFGNKETGKQVNTLFESKLLLKNQKQGLVTWAKKITGIKPDAKRDLISRIEKMDNILEKQGDDFLEDIAEKRLGISVTDTEAKNILELSKKLKEAKPETLDYGVARRVLEKHVSDLKISAEALTIKEYITNPLKAISFLGGLTKSLRATFDNSFIGRQGLPVLFSKPKIWLDNSINSFKVIGRTIRGNQTIKGLDESDAIIAEIYSRKNFDKMRRAKLDIGTGEEAFPTSLPERIPLLGRFFKASEQAYTGTAYRMRADLFDHYLKLAESQGVNTNDKDILQGLGNLINSMTGRGRINSLSGKGQVMANNLFFSIKKLKSDLDNLIIQPLGGGGVGGIKSFAAKEARKNLMKMVAGIGSTLVLFDALKSGSVEWNPTSSDFGKIKEGNTRFDITGGIGSLLVLAARLVRQETKSTSTGQTNKLGTDYGQMSGSDLMWSFLEGKLSPLTSSVKHVLIDRSGYMGKELSVGNVIKDLTIPLEIDTMFETMKDPNSAPLLLTTILEGIGISANTYSPKEEKIKSKSIPLRQ
jgi:hypothetical protein